ncbi:MAG: hypothetical protein JOY54_19060 [Acidobacteriaceae bacterium]|nr:hypothetical protein [Acidobacteriaceae bacterium]
MQYAFLIYTELSLHASMTPEDAAAAINRNWNIIDEATARGVFRGVMRLESTTQSVTARRREGDASFTDGPFAETKEILGGFYLIDCKDDEEARYWAGRLTGTGCSTAVEFRPVAVVPERVPEAALASS